MTVLLDDVSTDVSGDGVDVVGPCMVQAWGDAYGGATIHLEGSVDGGVTWTTVGEEGDLQYDAMVLIDAAGPWKIRGRTSGTSGSTSGLNAVVNQ